MKADNAAIRRLLLSPKQEAIPEADQLLIRVRALWRSLETMQLNDYELDELIRLAQTQRQKSPRKTGRPRKSENQIEFAKKFSNFLTLIEMAPSERKKALQKFTRVSSKTLERRSRDKTPR